MRVTQKQVYRAQLLDADRKKSEQAGAARRGTSGLRLERPSDDPGGSRRSLLLRAAQEDYAIGRAKIDRAGAEYGVRETALASMTSALSRAREVSVSMANGTMSADNRVAAAAEITEIRETLIQLGNTRFMDRYLFAGAQTNAAAFDAAGVYQGDAILVSIDLPDGGSAEVTADGGDLLRGTGGAQSVLGAVEGMIAALQANNLPLIQAGLDELDDSIDYVVQTRSEFGASVNLIENLDMIFESAEIQVQESRSEVEDMDVVVAYSEVVRTGQAYEQALQVMSRSRTPSIFELL
jgi:flagellar hook-associated protein 3 FlgL